jgi:hypothetical protein
MTVEPVAVYAGRMKIGAIIAKADAFEARDAAGRKVGAPFPTRRAAMRAVVQAAKSRPTIH